jgi:hypothetical protein
LKGVFIYNYVNKNFERGFWTTAFAGVQCCLLQKKDNMFLDYYLLNIGQVGGSDWVWHSTQVSELSSSPIIQEKDEILLGFPNK